MMGHDPGPGEKPGRRNVIRAYLLARSINGNADLGKAILEAAITYGIEAGRDDLVFLAGIRPPGNGTVRTMDPSNTTRRLTARWSV